MKKKKKRKEIQEFKVFEDIRTVKVYNRTLSDKAEKDITRFRDVGYKIILLDREKPKARTSQRIGKEQMKKYLKDNIDNKIYNQLVKKLDTKERFCDVRHWLKEQLQEQANKSKTIYVPANTIIQVAMKNEEITSQANAIKYKKDNIIAPKVEQEEQAE